MLGQANVWAGRWKLRSDLKTLGDQIWRQVCLGNAVNASRSVRAASRCSATLGNLSVSASMIRSYWAATDSASRWPNTECSRMRTHGYEDYGDGHQVGRVMSPAATMPLAA
jgi:hypothetical protein